MGERDLSDDMVVKLLTDLLACQPDIYRTLSHNHLNYLILKFEINA